MDALIQRCENLLKKTSTATTEQASGADVDGEGQSIAEEIKVLCRDEKNRNLLASNVRISQTLKMFLIQSMEMKSYGLMVKTIAAIANIVANGSPISKGKLAHSSAQPVFQEMKVLLMKLVSMSSSSDGKDGNELDSVDSRVKVVRLALLAIANFASQGDDAILALKNVGIIAAFLAIIQNPAFVGVLPSVILAMARMAQSKQGARYLLKEDVLGSILANFDLESTDEDAIATMECSKNEFVSLLGDMFEAVEYEPVELEKVPKIVEFLVSDIEGIRKSTSTADKSAGELIIKTLNHSATSSSAQSAKSGSASGESQGALSDKRKLILFKAKCLEKCEEIVQKGLSAFLPWSADMVTSADKAAVDEKYVNVVQILVSLTTTTPEAARAENGVNATISQKCFDLGLDGNVVSIIEKSSASIDDYCDWERKTNPEKPMQTRDTILPYARLRLSSLAFFANLTSSERGSIAVTTRMKCPQILFSIMKTMIDFDLEATRTSVNAIRNLCLPVANRAIMAASVMETAEWFPFKSFDPNSIGLIVASLRLVLTQSADKNKESSVECPPASLITAYVNSNLEKTHPIVRVEMARVIACTMILVKSKAGGAQKDDIIQVLRSVEVLGFVLFLLACEFDELHFEALSGIVGILSGSAMSDADKAALLKLQLVPEMDLRTRLAELIKPATKSATNTNAKSSTKVKKGSEKVSALASSLLQLLQHQ